MLRFPLARRRRVLDDRRDLRRPTIDGLPFIGTDSVDVDVTGGRQLDVPYVEFSPVLRVRTHVTRTPSTGTPVVDKRTTIFMFECFGEVARAESKPDEPTADFTTAAYLRRFALGDDTMIWDMWKKGFAAWEQATAQYMEKVLQNPARARAGRRDAHRRDEDEGRDRSRDVARGGPRAACRRGAIRSARSTSSTSSRAGSTTSRSSCAAKQGS